MKPEHTDNSKFNTPNANGLPIQDPATMPSPADGSLSPEVLADIYAGLAARHGFTTLPTGPVATPGQEGEQ